MKKILVFDINPDSDAITKELVFGKIANDIRKNAKDKVLIFLTNSSLKSFLPLIEQLKINHGYIVSDSGARIYNIESKKILIQQSIALDDVLAMIHYGIYCNDLVLLSTKSKEYVYGLNCVSVNSLLKKRQFNLSQVNIFNKFLEYAKKEEIYSITLCGRNIEKINSTYEKINNIIKDWNIKIQIGINPYLNITSKNISKLISIQKIMDEVQEFNNDNIYYFALNTYDDECLVAFNNRYVLQDIVLNSKLLDKGVSFELDIPRIKETIFHILNK